MNNTFTYFWQNWILPKTIYMNYFFTRVTLELFNIFTFQKFSKLISTNQKSLCIEAGENGWKLIELNELYLSASEYVNTENVQKVSIKKNENYLNQIKKAIQLYKPTHYIYDARTGSQNWFIGMIQAFRIAILFQVNGIVPVCILTDLPVRSWRRQTSMVSAKRGVVISLMSPKDIHSIFPHSRIIGPLLMPFSKARLNYLSELSTKNRNSETTSCIFVGSLYEPRTTILKEISEGLNKKGITLEIKGRELGTKKPSEDQYWTRLMDASIVITTADQIESKDSDWTWIPHLIYRYLEVPIAGSLLVAQEVPSLSRYFSPGIHYVKYDSINDAIEKITYYMENKEEMDQITKCGFEKATNIVKSNLYWVVIDNALGKYSLK